MIFSHTKFSLQIDSPTGKQYTFAQLLRMPKNTASGLAEYGVLKNDVVAIFSPNSIDYIVMQLGALAAGATVTTINSGCTPCKTSDWSLIQDLY